MERDWVIRKYKDGDEKAILDLYKIVFRSEMTLDHWQWKYKNNPAGPSFVILAEVNGKLVGHFALLSRLFKVGQQVVLGALSVDTMVHPDYRRQGMHIVMGKQACELATQEKVQFTYGFSNGLSHRNANIKLGFKGIYNGGIPLWVKPLNTNNIIKNRFVSNQILVKLGGSISKLGINLFYPQIKIDTPYHIRRLSNFDEQNDNLWDRFSKDFSILVVRDSKYSNWRYINHPQNPYTIYSADHDGSLLGIIVIRFLDQIGLKSGFVVDLMIDPNFPDVAGALISTAIGYSHAQQADIVGCMMLPNALYSRILKQMGFINTPMWLMPQKMYLDVNMQISSYSSSFLSDPHHWYVTWSDHDVI